MTLLIVIVVLALIFDYINGFHDAANSIATIVSTKVLTPYQAVVWAAFFNFVAYFIFKDHAVANTIGKTVHQDYITLPVILSGLIAAIIWNLLTWWYGIPSSSSHTLIGGFAGAAITHAFLSKGFMGISNIVEIKKITQIILFIFLAPLIGMVVSIYLTVITIMRSTWAKIGLIVLTAIGTWFLFAHFEQTKLQENLVKYYNIDQLKKEQAADPSKTAKYNDAVAKVTAVTPLLGQYKSLGAVKLAEEIKNSVDNKVDTVSEFGAIKADFEYAEVLFIHIIDKIKTNDVADIYRDLKDLIAVLHNYQLPVYVPCNCIIYPYDLSAYFPGAVWGNITGTITSQTDLVSYIASQIQSSISGTVYAANVGNNSNTSFVITHGLNTKDVVVDIYKNINGEQVYADILRSAVNTVTVSFASAPTSNQYRVVIQK